MPFFFSAQFLLFFFVNNSSFFFFFSKLHLSIPVSVSFQCCQPHYFLPLNVVGETEYVLQFNIAA